MTYDKTILCLANSRKLSGRCVAGKEKFRSGYGDWVRPVSSRPEEEISNIERRYENGTMAKVLDVIRIPMEEPRPHLHQTENHLIDPGARWEKLGSATWKDVEAALDDVGGPLWINGHSSQNGHNDEIPEARLNEVRSSLYLIRPDKLELIFQKEGENYGPGKWKVRASFSLDGHRYKLVVTDPIIERKYRPRMNQSFAIDNAIICASLGELFRG